MQYVKITGFFVLAIAISACARDDTAVISKLDEMDKKITQIDERVQVLAKQGAVAQRQRPRRRGPKPGTVYSIPVDNAPIKGNKDARVTIVKVHEFACPACEATRPFVDQILAELGDRVKIAYKNFIVHPGRAEIPAYAACAADRQGQYDAMEKLLWNAFKARKLDKQHMITLATEAGLDVATFKADMDGACVKLVQEDHKQMKAIGTSGTPTFFVNGKVLTQRSLAGVKAMVEAAEKEAGQRIAQGTQAGQYYNEWVVKKGKKTL